MHGILITETTPPPGTVRLAVKDLFDTAGVRTTYGSKIFADHVPATSATAVTLLERAGYGSVGKANLHEFAWGITSDNPFYGRVPNPLAADRIAGGSSGGSAAALAAGLADAALGTDSGGSIRIPSACCGTTGFKPTHGLVPIDGCFALAPSYDHAGPMARDVAGCIAMLRALAPSVEVPEVGLADLKVGVSWVAEADAGVAAAVQRAAERFPGLTVRELPFPPDLQPLFSREVAEVHRELWPQHRADYGPNMAHKLARAYDYTDAEVETARGLRASYCDALDEALGDVDVVVTPTLTGVAPPAGIDELQLRAGVIRLTYPFNATGMPALALPCGTAEAGLPASIQLAARRGQDGLVLAAARALEAALA